MITLRQLADRLAEVERRQQVTGFTGFISEVNLDTARAKVRYGELGADGNLIEDRSGETAWLPWNAARAAPGGNSFWWAPQVGEAVVVLCIGGETGLGFILGAWFTTTAREALRARGTVDLPRSFAEHAVGIDNGDCRLVLCGGDSGLSTRSVFAKLEAHDERAGQGGLVQLQTSRHSGPEVVLSGDSVNIKRRGARTNRESGNPIAYQGSVVTGQIHYTDTNGNAHILNLINGRVSTGSSVGKVDP